MAGMYGEIKLKVILIYKNMTQHELIISYVKEFGKITPAKMYGKIYRDYMFGSETSKRARELRTKGILESKTDGKFEVFWLRNTIKIPIIGTIENGKIKYDRRHEARKTPEFDDLNSQLKELLKKLKPSFENYKMIDEIQRAIRAKYPETKRGVLEYYRDRI